MLDEAMERVFNEECHFCSLPARADSDVAPPACDTGSPILFQDCNQGYDIDEVDLGRFRMITTLSLLCYIGPPFCDGETEVIGSALEPGKTAHSFNIV